ncbi:hypothetical protein J4410_06685 [Candidatus Woesearchaeota archaeon]|nr:hypothetical protein [Candidatus Woesearchaeota archaeon]
MVNVSQVVQKIIESRPMLQEAISQNIVSFANLAEHLKPRVESLLGEKVKEAAIVMALRRYAEKENKKEPKKLPFKFDSQITMKTGLADITIVKTASALTKLKQIYDLIEYEKGETLNIIQGDYEITIVISQKYVENILLILKEEKIKNIEKDLVSVSMTFSKEFLYTPGSLARATRKLAWENINIFENISTMTELIFIVNKKDATRAYNALQELIEE